MKHSLKGLVAVVVLSAVMGVGWKAYRDFLTQGSRPSESVIRLNEIEKNGVPDFTLTDVAGETVHLSDFKDRMVIINFWASWCNPCIEEFPSLISLINKYKGKIVLLAISGDNTESDLLSFLKAFHVKSPHIKVMWDKDLKVAGLYGTKVLPESYILGPNQQLIRKVAGVDKWDSSDALSFFEEQLGGNSAPEAAPSKHLSQGK